MPTHPDLGVVLHFLDELRNNNYKAWFDGHRPTYQAARADYEQFINDLIDEFRTSDHLQALSAKDCIPRIYRDIRFSRDKTPYKTNMGALIAPGGWRTTAQGYYISLEPGYSMVAGGLHAPSAEQLNRFRQAIDRDASAFKTVVRLKDFAETFGEVQGDRLKTAPKGYEREHPEIALLQLKQVWVAHRFTDQEVLADDFMNQVVKACQTMRPFLDVLTDMLQQG